MPGPATLAILFAQLASSRPEPVAIEVAGEGCPAESELRAEAERRAGERRDPSRTLAVRVGPSAGGFSATVEVRDRKDGATIASRTVEGATCEGVANAALLLVALGSHDEPEAPNKDEGPHTTENGAVGSASDPPSDTASKAIDAEPSRARLAFHAAALSALVGGAGPVAVGGGVRIAGAREAAGLFRPEIAVGLDGFLDATIAHSSGRATRSLVSGRADVCPVGVGSGRLVARLCASGALGEFRVRGEGVPRTKDEGRLYSAIGGSVRTRVRIVKGIGIEVAAGWLAPLQAHRFYFEPNETLVTLAPAPFAEGGLSWSLP